MSLITTVDETCDFYCMGYYSVQSAVCLFVCLPFLSHSCCVKMAKRVVELFTVTVVCSDQKVSDTKSYIAYDFLSVLLLTTNMDCV